MARYISQGQRISVGASSSRWRRARSSAHTGSPNLVRGAIQGDPDDRSSRERSRRRLLGHRRREALHHERRTGGDVHRGRPDRHRATTSPEISGFIVPADTPGFTVGRLEDKLGLHASATGELQFDGARVPAANLLGERGSGFKLFLAILDGGRISIAALALGLAQAALDAACPMRGRASSSAGRSAASRASHS